jgi:hypothetical protein
MSELDPNISHDLARLGETLEQAARHDLRARARAAGSLRRLHLSRLPRRPMLIAAVLAITIPGVAVGAAKLISNDDVSQSIPAGTRMLIGTEPLCTTVIQDVEYHCVLSRPPAPEVSDFKGTVEPTVDSSRHVNGGCRSLTSDGLEWQCYIGKAAVEQRIIGEGFLGEYAPTPGVG